MPRLFAVAHYALALLLSAQGLFFLFRMTVGKFSLWWVWLPALCLLAAVGLIRRLAWGRDLASGLSVVNALICAMLIMPDVEGAYHGPGALESALGYVPQSWLIWLVMVSAAALILLPATIIGRRQQWYREDFW